MGQPRWPKPGPRLPTSPPSLPLLIIPLLTILSASTLASHANAAPAAPQSGTVAAPSGSFRLTPSGLGANNPPTLLPPQPQPASPTLPPVASSSNGLVPQVRVGAGTAAAVPAAAAEASSARRGTGAATPSANPTQAAAAIAPASTAAAAGGPVAPSASGGGRAESVSVTGGQQQQQQQQDQQDQQQQDVTPSGPAAGSDGEEGAAPAGPGAAAAAAATAQPAALADAAAIAGPTEAARQQRACEAVLEDVSDDFSYEDGDTARPAAVVVAAATAGCARPGALGSGPRASGIAVTGTGSSDSVAPGGAGGTNGVGQEEKQQQWVSDVGRLRSRFWVGVNLGNVPLFPLSGARLQQGEQELRAKLEDAVKELAAAGGNLIRVWLHTDGSRSPCWGSKNSSSSSSSSSSNQKVVEVVGCNAEAVEDLKWFLRLAHRHGLKVLLVLWSHDMLAVRRDNPPAHRDRALHMVRTASGTSSYVNNCLWPLVRHLARTPIPSKDSPGALATGSAAPVNPQSPRTRQNVTGRRLAAAPPAPSATTTTVSPAATVGAGDATPQGGSGGSPRAHASTPPAAVKPPATSTPVQQSAAAAGPTGSVPAGQQQTAEPGAAAPKPSRPQQQRRRTSSVLITPKDVPGGPDGDGDGPTDGEAAGTAAGVRAALRRLLGVGGAQPPGMDGQQGPEPRQLPSGSTSAPTKAGMTGNDGAVSASIDTRSGTPASAATVATAPPDASIAAAAAAAAADTLTPGAAASEPADAGAAAAAAAAAAAKPPAASPTYSSVILGYEVLNEPEGMAWDLRLYHNYMYDMLWGPYNLEKPDWYDWQPQRKTDYRSYQVLKAFGGIPGEQHVPEDRRSDLAGYRGWYFVGGRRADSSSSNDRCSNGGRLQLDGLKDRTRDVDAQEDAPSVPETCPPVTLPGAAPASFAALGDRSGGANPRPEACTPAAGVRVGACGRRRGDGGTPAAWYDNSTLAAAWEGLAARAAVTSPSGRGNGSADQQEGDTPAWNLPAGLWLNRLMYQDVVAKHNSEMPYLLPLVASCSLRTEQVTVPQLQRFVSRLAAAIHSADPTALVGVGQHSLPYCTDAKWLSGRINDFEAHPRNLYSDWALRSAFRLRNRTSSSSRSAATATALAVDPDTGGWLGPGWDPTGLGTLDFYAPHGYPHWGHDEETKLLSPFFVKAHRDGGSSDGGNDDNTFDLPKPTLIGEFWDQVTDTEKLTAAHWSKLQELGYVGGLGWAMFEAAEAPLTGPNSSGGDNGSNGDGQPAGRQLSAPRRLAKHEKRDAYLALIREMASSRGG